MSVDRSLKIKGALMRHRNVLSRAERVEKLKDEEKWVEGDSVFALPKVVHRKSHAGRKAKAAAKEAALAEAAATAEAAPVGLDASAAPEKMPKPGAKPAAKPDAKPATKPASKPAAKKEN